MSEWGVSNEFSSAAPYRRGPISLLSYANGTNCASGSGKRGYLSGDHGGQTIKKNADLE
jgi:hypothetical protein